MRPGEELKDGPPIHGNTRLEIIWTAIPAILLVALCSYSYVSLTDIEEAEADALNVRVVGEQFTWTFYYKDPSGKEFASPQLYVPRGKPVTSRSSRKDVIHDFWVPAFRMKIDAVPGINTHLRITPKTNGEYPVVCAELCGLGHAVMRQTAHVVEQAEFDGWLERARRRREAAAARGGARRPAAAPARRTARRSSPTPAAAAATRWPTPARPAAPGPDLDEGLEGKDEAFIEQSIVDPSAEVTKGFSDGIMPPNFGDTLQPAELDALVKYLAEVTK